MPDYFDRLVARAADWPDAPEAVPKVRPRLPDPFERPPRAQLEQFETVDAPPFTAPVPDDPPVPSLPAPPFPLPRPDFPAAGPEPRPEPVRQAERIVSVPSGQVRETLRRLVDRLEVRTEVVAAPPVRPAAPRAPRAGRPTGHRETVPAPVRPSVVDIRLAGRAQEPGGTARSPGERRAQPPPAERVVRVSIGKLAVKAAAQPEQPRPRGGQRPSPVVSLDRYLAGEGGGS
ncbi:hypothetical protein [Amycolatopsis nigrescens]|uniref:hypothetical protein n=1 Tax=Amycolatopsis nigrescens TaxID=381445 RepID=UPI00039E96FE|nr:hypothetical protein [Amycolatopsis nigrescens]